MLTLHTSRLSHGLFFFTTLFALFSAGPAYAQSNGAQALPAPGKALVFVFRKDRAPLPAPVSAYVNSKKLGQLSNNSYVSTTVEPGATKIVIGDGAPTRLDIVAAPNQRYFVRVDAVFGVTVVRTEAQLTSEQEGLRAIGQSRFAGETAPPASPAITAATAAASAPAAPTTAAPLVAATHATSAAAPQKIQPPVVTRPSSSAPASAASVPRASPNVTAAIPVAPQRVTEPMPQASSSSDVDSKRKFSVSISTGQFAVSNTKQTLAGLSSTYDASSKSVLSLQGEWRDTSGLAVGGELYTYSNDISTSGGAPDAKQDATVFMANAKYYVRTGMGLQPFVGAGLGLASATYSGTLTGSATGMAYQALLGAELRLSRATLHVQYKFLSATVGSPDSISVGGSGILLGAGFLF